MDKLDKLPSEDKAALIAIAVDVDEIRRVIRNLARMRVLWTFCSTETYHQDLWWFAPFLDTRVEIGENIPKEKFDYLVASEEAAIIDRFCAYVDQYYLQPDYILTWIAQANKARRSFAQKYQQALDQQRQINNDLGRRLTYLKMAAEVTQCAAELGLVALGALPVGMITAATGATMVTGSGAAISAGTWAWSKLAISVAAGTSISIADNWNAPTKYDMCIAVAKDDANSAVQSSPGTAADALEVKFEKITSVIMSYAHRSFAGKLKPGGSLRKAKEAWAGKTNIVAAGTKVVKTGGHVFTMFGYAFALWSAKDSVDKLRKRMTADYNDLDR